MLKFEFKPLMCNEPGCTVQPYWVMRSYFKGLADGEPFVYCMHHGQNRRAALMAKWGVEAVEVNTEVCGSQEDR